MLVIPKHKKYQSILSMNKKKIWETLRVSNDKVLVRELEVRMRGQTPEWRFSVKRVRIYGSYVR